MTRRSVLALPLAAAAAPAAETMPKVRAITAFVNVDPQTFDRQIRDAVAFLSAVRDRYHAAGFDVETIRVATQPFPQYTASLSHDAALEMLRHIDDLGIKLGCMTAIGPAMSHDADDPKAVDLLADFLAKPAKTNACLVTASDAGIHWNAIRQAARLIDSVSRRSAHGQGNLNFAAISMLKPHCPFYPGAYNAGAAKAFSVGLEGAGVVIDVFKRARDPRTAGQALTAALTKYAQQAETIAMKAATPAWTYAGLDPTPAPLGEVSIGRAIETFTGNAFGAPGTMTAVRIITAAVQSVPVKRVGYSGLMVPVLEDAVLVRRWAERTFTRDSLLAYSAVCAGGLDTVPLPGDIGQEQIAEILSDVASLAHKWQKPLAARLLPVPGRKSGEQTEFEDSRMANTLIQ